jgi:hypothetical protein
MIPRRSSMAVRCHRASLSSPVLPTRAPRCVFRSARILPVHPVRETELRQPFTVKSGESAAAPAAPASRTDPDLTV